MGRNYRGSSSRGTILFVTNGCQLRSRGPKVRCLSELGAHTNLDWHGGCASTLESASSLLSSSEGSWIVGKLTKLALNPEESVPGVACPWGGEHEGRSTRMFMPRKPVSPHLWINVPVREAVPAETAGSETWGRWHGRIFGPV